MLLQQFGVFFLSLLLFAVWGLPAAAALQGTMPQAVWSTPAFGIAALTVVSAVLYVSGVPVRIVGFAVVAVAVAFSVIYRRRLAEMIAAARRFPLATALLALSVAVICSPLFAGDVRFTVFQGNQWDQLLYLTSAATFSKLPFSAVKSATDGDFLANPLLVLARDQSTARPSVSILFAVIASLVRGSLPVAGYAFLCSLATCGLLSLVGFLRQVFGRARHHEAALAALLAGVIACGFWGQYPLDIDAWAHVAALPLFLSAWTLIFAELADDPAAGSRGARSLLGLAWLFAGALYLYPEASSFHALILAGVLLVTRSRVAATRIGGALLLAVAVGALFWSGTLASLVGQVISATTKRVTWWTYFDAYLFGQDPAFLEWLRQAAASGAVRHPLSLLHSVFPFVAPLTGIAGMLGVYFLTPLTDASLSLPDVARVAALVIVAVGAAASVVVGWRTRDRAYRLVLACVGFGLLGAALLVAGGQAWSGGKALSYTAPFLCLAIAAPVMIARDRRAAGLRAAPWLLAQTGFAALCLVGLGDPDGVRLRAPYPDIQDLALKTDIDWELAPRLSRFDSCAKVKIDAPNPFFRQYAAISLYDDGKRFFFTQPVNTYFGVGTDIGVMAEAAVTPDCTLVQQPPSRRP